MADLLDITGLTACEVIKINGDRVTVRGLSGPTIAALVGRFPHLGAVVGGGAVGVQLILQFGHAIGPIIAASVGHLGDEAYEKHASEFPVEVQLELIDAIKRVTFPKGLVSFAEKLTALLMGADEGVKPLKLRLRKSRSPSQNSSDLASHQIM